MKIYSMRLVLVPLDVYSFVVVVLPVIDIWAYTCFQKAWGKYLLVRAR